MTMAALFSCRAVALQVGRAGSRRVLLEGLDWEVEAGQRWAVLGPNGAGKSSLLSALAGVRRVDGGTLACDGVPLSALDVGELAARRALVADRWFDPFPASVTQTVLTGRYRFGAEENGARALARALLAQLDCGHLAQADVRQLSRGERQRVAIATALVQETPLVLLDEPLAHQDPRHQAVVLDVLRETRSRTVIASLHDVNAALRFATHALLLTGRGPWWAGPAEAVLTVDQMSALFGTPFVELHGGAAGGAVRLLVLVQQSVAAGNSPRL
jgi:iron complex transport system ATP-binding protein